MLFLNEFPAFSFRINPVNTINGYCSANIAKEQRIDHSVNNESGLLEAPSNNYPGMCVATSSNINGNTNRNTHGNTKGKAPLVEYLWLKSHVKNGFSFSDHVCTISCAQVQCAKEEYEASVYHAFNIMKPPNYSIIEVTSAVFPADPMCRWIVAYIHDNEPVSCFNADEIFEDITRSIPNNVRINQKYIRGNSSQVLAAYVIVYSVNCRCHQQSSEIYDFTVNEIKCEF